MGQPTHMDHSEALQQMATERYLLDELSPELRDAYEEHLFDCTECALDLRAAEAFVTEARVQLPGVTTPERQRNGADQAPPATQSRKSPFSWLRPFFANPVFAAPAFAALLLVLGYQNLVTYPTLRSKVDSPSIQPWTSIHAVTRGGDHVSVLADSVHGAMLLLDLPQQAEYISYSIVVSTSTGKSVWSQSVSSAQASAHDGTVSLHIPASRIVQRTHLLTVFGVNSSGQKTQIEQQPLEFVVSHS